jgi:hypothetical protein
MNPSALHPFLSPTYPFASQVCSGFIRGRVTRAIFGPVDFYVVLVFDPNAPASRATAWIRDNPKAFIGWGQKTCVLLPRMVNNSPYWSDVTEALSTMLDPDMAQRCDWRRENFYFVCTHVNPQLHTGSNEPMLRLDVTHAHLAEMEFAALSLRRLASRNRLGMLWTARGLGRALFERRLEELPCALNKSNVIVYRGEVLG